MSRRIRIMCYHIAPGHGFHGFHSCPVRFVDKICLQLLGHLMSHLVTGLLIWHSFQHLVITKYGEVSFAIKLIAITYEGSQKQPYGGIIIGRKMVLLFLPRPLSEGQDVVKGWQFFHSPQNGQKCQKAHYFLTIFHP